MRAVSKFTTFVTREYVKDFFAGKSVAIVGSGPGCLENPPGLIDSHDIVCRINNFKTSEPTGFRTDVFYSFHGASIHKTSRELKECGVKLVLCKCPECPSGPFIESEWHRKNGKMHGVDFSYIYRSRADWWFCDTYVPSMEEFTASFQLLGQHIPSTGFSALLLILACKPKSILLSGFDFFASRIHNVDEPWRPGNPDDPIGHAPERERAWLKEHADRVTMDKRLAEIMA